MKRVSLFSIVSMAWQFFVISASHNQFKSRKCVELLVLHKNIPTPTQISWNVDEQGEVDGWVLRSTPTQTPHQTPHQTPTHFYVVSFAITCFYVASEARLQARVLLARLASWGGGVWVGLWVGVRWVDPPIQNAHKQWDVAVLRWVLGSFCEFVEIYMQRMRSASRLIEKAFWWKFLGLRWIVNQEFQWALQLFGASQRNDFCGNVNGDRAHLAACSTPVCGHIALLGFVAKLRLTR